ncbi:MAG: type I restriction-modification system subunit M [Candidatus Coproplasma sp.]
MNKQQLASLIWDYCNGLRGSISTVEYKDVILGFIFYRYLSECEEKDLLSMDWTYEDMATDLNEDDEETVKHCQNKWGYFIKYDYLFSTWYKNLENDFNVSIVTDALSAFTRNIDNDYQTIYKDIFKSLKDKLSKLGTIQEQTKHIKKVIKIVNYIPMDGRQGYDVLGFIYEYLLANFASNAGKKDGEFYTPHEISVLMSDIVSHHLQGREEINIFDPTSGSGSLLINIGQSLQKYLTDKDKIVYYAQEKIDDTYNLTRMNLVMRGIKPANIFVRCADTLATDWPYIDDRNEYRYIPVDCVVSNPPYSQKWDAKNHLNDKRYREYGIAPASKADYAFLLHDLYHLKDDGIMCIVLPHGVLFRGGDEGEIRKQLVEKNNIEAIIGLPANIFYGTGIPTIIMVLKKHRETSDILFIDASKEFEKNGNKNKLSGCNIKKITDAVIERKDIPYFAKLVSKQTIKDNGYNLNIPRYISSNVPETPIDINATVLGNIPNYEIDVFEKYWNEFGSLREELFEKLNDHLSKVKCEAISATIHNNKDVVAFDTKFKEAFAKLEEFLYKKLIEQKIENVFALKEEISNYLFDTCKDFSLVDKYAVYRAFDSVWDMISIDLKTIQEEGFEAARKTEDVKVYDKKNEEISDKKNENGKIIPFELIAKVMFGEDFNKLEELNKKLESAIAEFDSYWADLDEDIKEELKKQDDKKESDDVKLDTKVLKKKKEEVYESLENDLIKRYNEYLSLSTKEQIQFEKDHPEMAWPAEEKRTRKGVFKASDFKSIILNLKDTMEIDEEDEDYKVRKLFFLNQNVSAIKKERNDCKKEIDLKAVEKLAVLTDEEIKILLNAKWILPIMVNINKIPQDITKAFIKKLNELLIRYENPLFIVDKEIKEIEEECYNLIDDLQGDEFDMLGLKEVQKLFRGE